MNARRFIGAVLAPHHAEDAEFGDRGLAVAEKLLDLLVFLGREAVLPENLRRKGRSQRGGHGRSFYCRISEGRRVARGQPPLYLLSRALLLRFCCHEINRRGNGGAHRSRENGPGE